MLFFKMKNLLDIINRGVFRGLHEHEIELLTDLEDDELGQLDSIQVKSINDKYNAIKQQLKVSIRTGKISKSLKEIINNPTNFHKYKSVIKANDKDHLKELIEIGQELLGDDGNFNWIGTSNITDMSNLFFENSAFNGHIELWDVSNVTNMWGMFSSADSFNQPIGDWDVSNVTDMQYMFQDAKEFNQPIGDWDVNNVTNMYCMFWHAYKFNQPIGGWDVSNVTNMSWMFKFAKEFNQPIRGWDVSNVTTMTHMFWGALKFNQPLYTWDVSKVIQHDSVFKGCPIDEEYKPKFK